MGAGIIKPPRLRKGEQIGVLAPASPVTPSELAPGIDLLEARGYRLRAAPHLYRSKGYLAGDDEERLDDLHAMFRDPEVRAVICARGGYGTPRLLERIDYGLIRANPKIVVGYSDVTALLWGIYAKTGLITFHGPMIREISAERAPDLGSLLALVSLRRRLALRLPKGRMLRPGKAEGALLGGNLSLIAHLVGSPFMPDLKGAILFVEERGEALYRIDRMLTHLRLSGILSDLAALLVGHVEDAGDSSALDALLLEVTSHLDIPLVSGLPVGHGLENITLPIGLRAGLDTADMSLRTRESCVAP